MDPLSLTQHLEHCTVCDECVQDQMDAREVRERDARAAARLLEMGFPLALVRAIYDEG